MSFYDLLVDYNKSITINSSGTLQPRKGHSGGTTPPMCPILPVGQNTPLSPTRYKEGDYLDFPSGEQVRIIKVHTDSWGDGALFADIEYKNGNTRTHSFMSLDDLLGKRRILKKCECGACKTYGEDTILHSYWCPRSQK